jgi:anaerobic magnesium-protoporphyrin IX monomethyl ester cyclase
MKIVLLIPPPAKRYVFARGEPLAFEYLWEASLSGHECVLIDALAETHTVDQLVQRILRKEPDCLCVSLTFTSAFANMLAICTKVKQWGKDILIIAGGNSATFLHDKLLESDAVDFVVRGEGEIALRTLLAARAHRATAAIKGVAWKKDGVIIDNGMTEPVSNLDSIRFPRESRKHLAVSYHRSILTARGCCYGCLYCSAGAFWNGTYRTRSIENIKEEILFLCEELNTEGISFADDCFTINEGRLAAICDLVSEISPHLQWSCTGRIEKASAFLIDKMSKAGCKAIFFGVESASPRTLKRLNRRYTARDVREVYKRCIEAGIRPSFSFIIGLPFESEDDIRKSIELIDKLSGCDTGVHMLTPFPGTPIATNPKRFGIAASFESIEELEMNTNVVLSTSKLSTAKIRSLFREAVGVSCNSLRRSPQSSRP